MIKLITCDLDGTLFDKEKNISDENKKAIKGLKDAIFVVATGRPFEGLLPVNKELDLIKDGHYSICYNGAIVLENATNKIIFARTIKGSVVKRIYHESLRLGTSFHAFRVNGELITNKHNPYTAVEEKINKIEAKVTNIDDIDDNEEFLKAMLVDDKAVLDRITPQIDRSILEEVNMVRSAIIFLEFINKECNKGLALTYLASYLNIDLKDAMAIGDADNDISMIKAAGVGVAMKNAFEVVFEHADFVTLDNENSGVAYAINKFCK